MLRVKLNEGAFACGLLVETGIDGKLARAIIKAVNRAKDAGLLSFDSIRGERNRCGAFLQRMKV